MSFACLALAHPCTLESQRPSPFGTEVLRCLYENVFSCRAPLCVCVEVPGSSTGVVSREKYKRPASDPVDRNLIPCNQICPPGEIYGAILTQINSKAQSASSFRFSSSFFEIPIKIPEISEYLQYGSVVFFSKFL